MDEGRRSSTRTRLHARAPLVPEFERLAQASPRPRGASCVRPRESGLTIRAAASEEDVAEFHAIAVETVRRRGGKPKPYSLYERIWRTLVPTGLARFHLCITTKRRWREASHLFIRARR